MQKLWCIALAFGALLPRAYLILKFRSALIESDEAIVGLMARHILRGEAPIFYYGQNYMGSLEAFGAAFLFWILGANPVALKIAPLLFFFGFVVTHYFLALHIADRKIAILATTLVAVSPSFLTIWSLKARGGYMALLMLGTLALLLAARLLRNGYSRLYMALLGLTLGLAWWTHFLSLVYIVPILVMLLLRDERQLLTTKGSLLVAGFLVGSVPFWIFNIANSWEAISITGAQQTEVLNDIGNFLKTGMPMILGARRNWAGRTFFPLVGSISIAILVGSTLMLVWRWFWKPKPPLLEGKSLLLLFLLFFPILFSASGFAWFVNEPRYLLPLYSVLYILILSGVSKESTRIRIGVFVFLVALNLAGTLMTKVEEFTGYTNVESNGALIEFLQQRQIRRVYAPYWIAYRLTFESGEQIICTPPDDDVVRYEPYREMVRNAAKVAYVRLVAPRYRGLHADVKPPKEFASFQIGNYEVFTPGPP
ncbi:MAG: glycosyltransferase family 39 protein [Acidobacteria bacterium]|nr:glycosyltransferase family 39 protein [Acidobacteriota bacterium]